MPVFFPVHQTPHGASISFLRLSRVPTLRRVVWHEFHDWEPQIRFFSYFRWSPFPIQYTLKKKKIDKENIKIKK